MGELIDDLLTLSRVTRAEVRRTRVDLSGLAAKVVAQLRQLHPQRQVEFVLAPGLSAEGDPNLLSVALENLLGNAWKYTGRRPQARIEFSATAGDDGMTYLVRDDGAGFDPAYAGKLFQPFQRLHPPHEFDGHGIGLATVQRIVHKHGGRVWAEGAVGKGVTVYFTLPPGLWQV
jgi:light-regulated signal transduction histidine kinase (bacteriophytochrome)